MLVVIVIRSCPLEVVGPVQLVVSVKQIVGKEKPEQVDDNIQEFYKEIQQHSNS